MILVLASDLQRFSDLSKDLVGKLRQEEENVNTYRMTLLLVKTSLLTYWNSFLLCWK